MCDTFLKKIIAVGVLFLVLLLLFLPATIRKGLVKTNLMLNYKIRINNNQSKLQAFQQISHMAKLDIDKFTITNFSKKNSLQNKALKQRIVGETEIEIAALR